MVSQGSGRVTNWYMGRLCYIRSDSLCCVHFYSGTDVMSHSVKSNVEKKKPHDISCLGFFSVLIKAEQQCLIWREKGKEMVCGERVNLLGDQF